MTQNYFSKATQNLQGDFDNVPLDDSYQADQIHSPQFQYSSFVIDTHQDRFNTCQASIATQKPEECAANAGGGHEQSMAVKQYLSPSMEMTFSVNSKYIFNSETRFNSPETFENWQRKRTTESNIQQQRADSKIKAEGKDNQSRPSIERSKTIASQLSYTSIPVHARLHQATKQQTHKQVIVAPKNNKNLLLQRTEKKLRQALNELMILPQNSIFYTINQQQFCELLKKLNFLPYAVQDNSLEINYAIQVWNQFGGDKQVRFEDLIKLFMEFDNLSKQPVDEFFYNKLSYDRLNQNHLVKPSLSPRPTLPIKTQRLDKYHHAKLSQKLMVKPDNTNLYSLNKQRSISQMSQKVKEQQMHECSFHPLLNKSTAGSTLVPDLTLSKTRVKSPSVYHNTEAELKSVQLMDKGLKKRASVRSTESRQYRKNSDWQQSTDELKGNAHCKIQVKARMFYVDVNFGKQTQRLLINQGDSSSRIAQEFCLKHNLDRQIMNQFQKSLEDQISGILENFLQK